MHVVAFKSLPSSPVRIYKVSFHTETLPNYCSCLWWAETYFSLPCIKMVLDLLDSLTCPTHRLLVTQCVTSQAQHWFYNSSFLYVSVKSKLQHAPPPGQTPRHLTFLKIIVQISPYPGENAVQKPHTRVHWGDQMPPPRGHFTGTKMTERWWKRLQLSNKIL